MNQPAVARVAGVVLIALFSLFVVYPGHNPKPNDLPVAVAGPGSAAKPVVVALEAQGDQFSVVRVASESAARAATNNRDAYGALLPGSARVLVSTAASLSASTVITAVSQHVEGAGVKVMDVKPLVRNDPRNITIVLTTIAVIVPGMLGAAGLFFLAPALEGRRRIGMLGILAATGGLVAMLIVRVFMGALPGSYLALSGVTAAVIFAVSSVTSFFMLRLGTPGVLLGFLVFLILSNRDSGFKPFDSGTKWRQTRSVEVRADDGATPAQG